MRRLKLSLLPPFAPQKLLFPIDEHVRTIAGLKNRLIKSLAAVSLAGHAGALVLEIEGFELLPGSGIDIINEYDVVQYALWSL